MISGTSTLQEQKKKRIYLRYAHNAIPAAVTAKESGECKPS
jgi:hypothetical protein